MTIDKIDKKTVISIASLILAVVIFIFETKALLAPKVLNSMDELLVWGMRMVFTFFALPIYGFARVFEFFGFVDEENSDFVQIKVFYYGVYSAMTIYVLITVLDKIF
jgi:hypothetical protein